MENTSNVWMHCKVAYTYNAIGCDENTSNVSTTVRTRTCTPCRLHVNFLSSFLYVLLRAVGYQTIFSIFTRSPSFFPISKSQWTCWLVRRRTRGCWSARYLAYQRVASRLISLFLQSYRTCILLLYFPRATTRRYMIMKCLIKMISWSLFVFHDKSFCPSRYRRFFFFLTSCMTLRFSFLLFNDRSR